jgi:hypothetical protein
LSCHDFCSIYSLVPLAPPYPAPLIWRLH